VVHWRGVAVVGVGEPAHVLGLLRAEGVHVQVGEGVDELPEDDCGPGFAEVRREVVADLGGALQRPAGMSSSMWAR
jgi:hypothetical protein